MKQARCIFGLLLILLVSGCAMPKPGMIRDLEILPQDAGAYHGLPADSPLTSPVAQAALYAEFLHRHYAAWDKTPAALPKGKAFWALKQYGGKELFGQNTLQRSPEWIEALKRESLVDSYPNMNRPCIAVTNTGMRSLPTREPAFYDFDKAGEGYPFDYMQNSLVLAGTPLRALQRSASGQWILVESRFAFGWVPFRDIAWTDEAFMNAFNAPAQIALTRDNVPVVDGKGVFRFTGNIGTILPLAQPPDGTSYRVLLPARDAQGNAVIAEGTIAADRAALMPLAATPENFARLANAMLGRPYGWGGLHEDRDCSATTMDLLAAFGIYLPRNSSQQYKQGAITEIDELSRNGKKKAIMEHGIPFLTLIRSPGHIMLYIGSHNGEPVVLQTMWGIKTQFMFGETGRHVIGRTVITTLEPGKELYNLSPAKGNVLDSVHGMTFLAVKKTSAPQQQDFRGK